MSQSGITGDIKIVYVLHNCVAYFQFQNWAHTVVPNSKVVLTSRLKFELPLAPAPTSQSHRAQTLPSSLHKLGKILDLDSVLVQLSPGPLLTPLCGRTAHWWISLIVLCIYDLVCFIDALCSLSFTLRSAILTT